MISNGCFDVKRCGTCAYTITEILIAFNKETSFETNYSFIPFWVIMMPSFNDISKKRSHDTPNLI